MNILSKTIFKKQIQDIENTGSNQSWMLFFAAISLKIQHNLWVLKDINLNDILKNGYPYLLSFLCHDK